MSSDLERAKAKLKANREGPKGDKKQTLSKAGIAAIMAENKRRGGSDVGEKRQSKSKKGAGFSIGEAAAAMKRRNNQTTDSNND